MRSRNYGACGDDKGNVFIAITMLWTSTRTALRSPLTASVSPGPSDLAEWIPELETLQSRLHIV